MPILYRHIRPDKNEVFYIGIGMEEERAYDKWNRSKFWLDIVNKNGGKFEVDILFYDIPTWEQACSKEIEFIKLYGRRNLNLGTLCNLTDGGDGSIGLIQSPETIEKRVSKRRGIPLSEEHKKKVGDSKRGENNPWFGKTFSEEHRQKISKGLTGRPCSEETRKKISNSNKGRQKNSEDFKKYLSEINSNGKHPQAKKVINTFTGEIFNTIKECAIHLGLKYDTLNAKLTGRNKNNTEYMCLVDYYKIIGE